MKQTFITDPEEIIEAKNTFTMINITNEKMLSKTGEGPQVLFHILGKKGMM